MTEQYSERSDGERLRDALRQWERQQSDAPGIDSVQRWIAASPSPMEQSRWSLRRSLRLSVWLAWAQLRIVPWLVIPVSVVTATMAVFAARFFGVSQGSSAAVSGFASLMLFGVAVTVTMALSTADADRVTLATPVGPQTVVLARVLMVLIVDTAAGVFASLLVSSWGMSPGLAAVLAGWMVPLAVIAGAVTFVAIWASPWAGVVVGVGLVPLVSPPSDAVLDFGFGSVSSAVQDVLTPVGVTGVGIGLLTFAIATARRALTSSVTAAA